jgi:hypothetical protein
MHFGESVREVVSMSCGKDLRSAKSRTILPGIDSPEIQRRLAANLERSFDITLTPEDLQHLTTVRAVLQCVRLRRWEKEMEEEGRLTAAAALAANAVPDTMPPMRERFVRYTPPAAPVHVPAAPSFALRKS